MSKLLLDYAFSFTEIESTPTASLEYLHNVGVIVNGFDPNDLDELTITVSADTNTIVDGASAEFSASASGGKEPYSYQWQTAASGETDFVDIEGETSNTLTATPALADTGIQYQCMVADSLNSTLTSDPISITVTSSTVESPTPITFIKTAPSVLSEDLPAKMVTVYSYEEAKTYTENTEIKALFDVGMNALSLLLITDVTQLDQFKESEMGSIFTLLGSSDFDTQELIDNQPLINGFSGDYGFATSDSELAKTIATTARTVCFYDTMGAYVGCYEAFGRLVSATYWNNQQYNKAVNNTLIGAVDELGLANSLFDSGVSFWMFDASMGTYLSSFFAGLEPIANDYILEEIETVQQSTGLNWISTNKPTNTTGDRMRLNNVMNNVLATYQNAPYYYLNPDFDNRVSLHTSSERYHVTGEMEIAIPDPIWKVDIEVTESSYTGVSA